MPRTLSELLATASALANQFATRAEAHDREASFPFDNVADLKAAQLPLVPVPVEFGGDGLGLYACVHILQRLAQGDASTALGIAMHYHVVGTLAETRPWADAAFAELCAEIVATGALVNSVASEPEMGSPSRGGLPATTATPVEGGFVLNGRKSWVTFAPALTFLLVTARLDEGIGVFVVRNGTHGITLVDTWRNSLSLRASGSFDVVLEDVFVESRWHVEQRAPGQRRGGLPAGWSACAFAAVYLGVGEAALRATARYCLQRVPTALGKPIAELPHVQRNLGQMTVVLKGAQAVLHQVAQRWDACPEARSTLEADLAAAKHLCTNAAITVTDLALRTVGAAGLERRLPLERYLRDARAGLMHPPQDDRALEILGKAALQEARQDACG
ncbi:MAG: acyl-CoA dehydrogenase family protein [Anaerolineae bacterium]|nr:acyl-CoA/acyl-ACP dehydrogenase [Thermoflexales bacterium]MDW8396786.1 acyl-CoA dehydrogenase family protein [Anaerolineae bacterium]